MTVFPSIHRIREMAAGEECLVIQRMGRTWALYRRNGGRLNGDDEPFPTKREACSFAWDWLGEYA